MIRLFKYGLAKELVEKKIKSQAITEFENLHINGKFKVWRPMNDYEYNQMLTIMTGAGILSKETGIQKNTESAPDEKARLVRQLQAEADRQQQIMQAQAQVAATQEPNINN